MHNTNKIVVSLLIYLFYSCFLFSQKLAVAPGLTVQASYFSKQVGNQKDFGTKSKFNATWFINTLVVQKKTTYILSISEPVFGDNFSIQTGFGSDTSLGIKKIGRSDGIDNLALTFSIRRDFSLPDLKNEKKIDWFYQLGICVGLNRSNNYYSEYFKKNINQRSTAYNYVEYSSSIIKKGMGFFISPAIGFKVLNAKNIPILFSEFYLDLGLSKMAEANISYKYGTYTTPVLYREVSNVKLNIKGTHFGLKVSVPIWIKNKEDKI